jgi:hypothetical protein
MEAQYLMEAKIKSFRKKWILQKARGLKSRGRENKNISEEKKTPKG